MADYTDLPDTAVGIGGIPSGTTVTALRDNPIAIAEGAVGAPRIVNEAITDATIGSEKFQSGTTEVDWVAGRVAGVSFGAVGSYALIRWSVAGSPPATGGTSSGSNLRYVSASGDIGGATPSGTWRMMGYSGDGSAQQETTLWLRIS